MRQPGVSHRATEDEDVQLDAWRRDYPESLTTTFTGQYNQTDAEGNAIRGMPSGLFVTGRDESEYSPQRRGSR